MSTAPSVRGKAARVAGATGPGDKRFLEEFPEGDGSRVKGTFYLTLIDGTPWYQTADNQPFVGKLRDAGENSGGYADRGTTRTATPTDSSASSASARCC